MHKEKLTLIYELFMLAASGVLPEKIRSVLDLESEKANEIQMSRVKMCHQITMHNETHILFVAFNSLVDCISILYQGESPTKWNHTYSELLAKFGDISFQEYLSKGISHPVFYSDLVYKLRRVKDKPNFISSGSKIIKRLRRRQYDPVIIERTRGLVLGPFTALYRPS